MPQDVTSRPRIARYQDDPSSTVPAGPARSYKRRLLGIFTRIERRLDALVAPIRPQMCWHYHSQVKLTKLNRSLPTTRTAALTSPFQTYGNKPSTSDFLSRWPWVDQAFVRSIARSKFDIHLTPGASSGRVFTIEGFLISSNGSISPVFRDEGVTLHSAFKDINTFLSAWHVYIMPPGFDSIDWENDRLLLFWLLMARHSLLHHSLFPITSKCPIPGLQSTQN